MKYKTAKVVGHPRSGTHYLTHLLNVNFFHLKNYLPLYAGHSNHHKQWLTDGNTAVFYMFRNNKDTIQSIYNMKERFGLKANSMEEFLSTKLCDLKDTKQKCNAVRNVPGQYQEFHDSDGYLGSHNQTIEAYLDSHKRKWTNWCMFADNGYIVRYENLINDFDNTMLNIAKFLKSNKTEFINESYRVGWYNKSDPEKKFA
jgi:hypothetical protein